MKDMSLHKVRLKPVRLLLTYFGDRDWLAHEDLVNYIDTHFRYEFYIGNEKYEKLVNPGTTLTGLQMNDWLESLPEVESANLAPALIGGSGGTVMWSGELKTNIEITSASFKIYDQGSWDAYRHQNIVVVAGWDEIEVREAWVENKGHFIVGRMFAIAQGTPFHRWTRTTARHGASGGGTNEDITEAIDNSYNILINDGHTQTVLPVGISRDHHGTDADLHQYHARDHFFPGGEFKFVDMKYARNLYIKDQAWLDVNQGNQYCQMEGIIVKSIDELVTGSLDNLDIYIELFEKDW